MRSLQIIKVLSEYLLFHERNRHSKKILGVRIREACEELGTTFIKFGQMLSTRYEVLEKQDCEALQKLLDDVKSIPYEKMREIFKHDFKKYPEEIFLEFNKLPIASASVSQVYRAKLHSGEDVVVKIRRPYLGRKILLDMNILKKLAIFAQVFFPILRTVRILELIDELKSWFMQEIDFERELENIKKGKKHYAFCDDKFFFKKLGKIKFVDAYEKYCSKNVLTMDFIEGVPLNKIKSIIHNEEYDLHLSLQTYINATIHSLFTEKEDYVFQMDTHPANIIIQKGGNVASIDHGLMGRISQENVVQMRKLFLSVYSGDLKNTIRDFLRICKVTKAKNPYKFREDLRKYLEKTPHEGIGFWFLGLLQISLKHKINPPPFMNVFARGNIVFDGTTKMLGGNITTLDLIKDELKTAMRKEIINNIRNIKYEAFLYSLSEKIRDSPKVASEILDDVYSKLRNLF